MDEYQAELQDAKKKLADFLASGKTATDVQDDLAALKTRLADISGKVKTGSGAPLADSVASRTETALNGSPESLKKAEEILTIGLSAAK